MSMIFSKSPTLLRLVLLLSLSGSALASQTCVATLDELHTVLGDKTFPLKWEETTMNDGKPLLVSIHENRGALFLEFTKTREGLWAESSGIICKNGEDLEFQFSNSQVRVGPAASWALRYALGHGGKFILKRLGSGQLRISTSGWNDVFSSRNI